MTNNTGNRDPFGSDIVTSPRDIGNSIDSLNREALRRLTNAFEQVLAAPTPRLGRNQDAVLVLSPEPGYGKSHLIGRLFQALDDSATLLYLRPFQDAASAWSSLLDKVVTELDHPDAAGKLKAGPGEYTQLDTLARNVLGSVMSRLLEGDRVTHPNKEEALRLFAKYPQSALEMPEWRTWLNENRPQVLRALDDLLKEQGLQLRPNRKAWLSILLNYAYSEEEPEVRDLCLDWLKYAPLDIEEGKRLGLRQADLPADELPYEQYNERCFQRLADLFTIGAYYRPFLLCFDQTEWYGNSATLARSLGVVVSRLRRETCNHFVVVTANAKVWHQKLRPNFEDADADAFDPRVVELEGMNETQVDELLRKRCAHWKIDSDLGAFCQQVRKTAFKEFDKRSVRDVIREARKQWSQVAEPNPETTFESYRLKLLAAPKELGFDAGVLQWVVENVLGPALVREVEHMRSPKGHFTVRWQDGQGRRDLFGFESGVHWKRWDGILREAQLYRADGGGEQVRSSLFRVPNQKKLADRTREALAKAKGSVHLVELSLEQAAEVFAAHDFAADVKQGNHDFSEEQTLAFLRQRLHGLAEALWADTVGSPSERPKLEMTEAIQIVVRKKQFVTLQLLRKELTAFPHASDDDLVKAASEIRFIKVHISPTNRVFQWVQ